MQQIAVYEAIKRNSDEDRNIKWLITEMPMLCQVQE